MSTWLTKTAERAKLAILTGKIAIAAAGPFTGPAVLQQASLQQPMNGAQYSQTISDARKKEYTDWYTVQNNRDRERMTQNPIGESNRQRAEQRQREAASRAGAPQRNSSSREQATGPVRKQGAVPTRSTPRNGPNTPKASPNNIPSPSRDRG